MEQQNKRHMWMVLLITALFAAAGALLGAVAYELHWLG